MSPRILAAVLDTTAPADVTVTALARALPWSWAEQERQLGVHCDTGQECKTIQSSVTPSQR